MSMSSRLTDAFARIGLEFKSVRSAIAQKYTKPASGIPLGDLSAGVTTLIDGKVSSPTSGLTIWVGSVNSLPTTKDSNTVYLAW